MNEKYSSIWYALVEIKAKDGFCFADLIDAEDSAENNKDCIGAFTNVLVAADTIQKAIEIIPLGMSELSFEVVKFDRIENFESLVDDASIDEYVVEEADWLLNTEFVFTISGPLHTFTNDD